MRRERLLLEEIGYRVLSRWFDGLGMDDPIWSPTTFSKNRERVLTSEIAAAFFDGVVTQALEAGLRSDEHFTRGQHTARSVDKPQQLPARRRAAASAG
jgi:transposase